MIDLQNIRHSRTISHNSRTDVRHTVNRKQLIKLIKTTRKQSTSCVNSSKYEIQKLLQANYAAYSAARAGYAAVAAANYASVTGWAFL